MYSVSSIVVANNWVSHTQSVLREAEVIVGSAVDMETGMRGYLLAGDEAFLEPYTAGQQRTHAAIDALQQTVSDNPAQVQRLEEAQQTLRDWQDKVTEPSIALRRDIGDAMTMNDMAAVVGRADGKVYFDRFRDQIARFIEVEEEQLRQREDRFQDILSFGSVDSLVANSVLNRVTEGYRVILGANHVLEAAVDIETGMRGFLLSGKDDFLQPYISGQEQFAEQIATLRDSVSSNPDQSALLDEISETIESWIQEYTEPTIALRRDIGHAKTMDDMADLVGEAQGKVYFDAFRALMQDFRQEEERLMVDRRADNDRMISFTYTAIVVCVGVALVLGIVIALVIGRVIANPIVTMTRFMQSLADGNVEGSVPGVGRKDEIGYMADAVEVFKQNKVTSDRLAERQRQEDALKEKEHQRIDALIQEFELTMGSVLENLGEADRSMHTVQSLVQSGAKDTKAESSTVAAAATQASQNVETVASAAEELSSSIAEIARQVGEASTVSQAAVDTADSTRKEIHVLEENVTKISEIVNLINDIAEQTNLLALNATIEAARAGDAGKGFAVVASEVKNLANQTARATDEIGTQIGAVQKSTGGAVASISRITDVIRQINEISSSISAAVEEQGAATQEIARNVEEAATGTQSVSISINDVVKAAERSEGAATQMTQTSETLSHETQTLRDKVAVFLRDVQRRELEGLA